MGALTGPSSVMMEMCLIKMPVPQSALTRGVAMGLSRPVKKRAILVTLTASRLMRHVVRTARRDAVAMAWLILIRERRVMMVI